MLVSVLITSSVSFALSFIKKLRVKSSPGLSIPRRLSAGIVTPLTPLTLTARVPLSEAAGIEAP